MELIRLRKKDLAESDASSVSSVDEKKPVKAPVKSANILTHLAEIVENQTQGSADTNETQIQTQAEADTDTNEIVQTHHETETDQIVQTHAETHAETHPETDDHDEMMSTRSHSESDVEANTTCSEQVKEFKISDKYVQLVQGSNIVSRVPGGNAASHLREWLLSDIPLPLGKTKDDLFKHMAGFWNLY